MYFVEAITDGSAALLHDPNPGERVVKLHSGKIHPALNAVSDFQFSLLRNHPQFGQLKPFKTLLRVTDEKGTVFWRGRVLDPAPKMGPYGLLSIDYTAEDELAYLLDSKQRHGEYHDITPKQYLQIILDNHNRSVAGDDIDKTILLGSVTVTNSTDNVYRYLAYDTSLSNILDDLVSSLGGYLSLRYADDGKRYLDYLTDSGGYSSMSIALADNLKSLESQQYPSQIISRLIPLGASINNTNPGAADASKARLTIESVNGGKDYLDDSGLVSQYGIIEGFVTWDDVTQPANLKAKGQAWLAGQRLSDSISITAADLSLIDESYESYQLGSYYRAENKALGIDRYYQLTAQEIDVVNPQESTLEFGDRKTTLTSYNGGVVGKEDLAANTSETLQKAKDNATALINAATTGYVVTRPHEILVMDTPEIATAAKIWRWNQNGLGFSDNGYNGPYDLAMTKDGQIVADRITTGTLNAELVRVINLIADHVRSTSGRYAMELYSAQLNLKDNERLRARIGTFYDPNNPDKTSGGIGIYNGDGKLDSVGTPIGDTVSSSIMPTYVIVGTQPGGKMCSGILAAGNLSASKYLSVFSEDWQKRTIIADVVENGLRMRTDNWWINDSARFRSYSSGAAGIYSEDNEVGIYGNTARVSGGGSRFDARADAFQFGNSGSRLVENYNNLDMHNYSILNQSDARLKTDIHPTDVRALELLNQIDLQKYRWIENGEYEDIGIIAQQLQEVAPDLVHENPSDGHLSIKTDKLLYYCIKAIQELSGKTESKPLELGLDPHDKWRYTRNAAKRANPKIDDEIIMEVDDDKKPDNATDMGA